MYELNVVYTGQTGEVETWAAAFLTEADAWEMGDLVARARGDSLISWDVLWIDG